MASRPIIPGNADDIVRLQRQIADLQAQLAARQQGDAGQAAQAIDTGGGAHVDGSGHRRRAFHRPRLHPGRQPGRPPR
jgi:hypothetical protein